MRQSARRWLYGTAVVAAVVASASFEAAWASGALPAGTHKVATKPASVRTAAATSALVAKNASAQPPKNLRLGASGPAIRSIQQRLNQLGYFAGPADGHYGSDLEEAVWAFKEVQGLPMNVYTNSVITTAFRRALAKPQQPYAEFPHGGADRIEVNLRTQVLVLYRHDQPHLILHISSGGGYHYCSQGVCEAAVTPDGSYTALSYMPGTITVRLGVMENPVFFIGTVYAIHGGEPVPWYPDSHGCIRIASDVVDWFHNQVHIGTTRIYIYGRAPYKPWIVGR
jgi:lipoprotein-anchoring transpeptidase ErfK/SrfK